MPPIKAATSTSQVANLNTGELVTALCTGSSTGAIYAGVALSFNLIFRTTDVFSFAQGSIVMLGAMSFYAFSVQFGMPILVALLATVACGACLGLATNVIAVKPLARRARGSSSGSWITMALVTTVGAGLLLNAGASSIWGTQPLQVPQLVSINSLHVDGVTIFSPAQLLLIGVVVALVVVLVLLDRLTLVGRIFSAISQDPEAASLRGVNVSRVGMASFVIGGGIAALIGFVMAPITYSSVGLGDSLSIFGFLALAIGGFESIPGALIGGLIVGIALSVSGLFVGAGFQDLVVLGVLAAVVLWRPYGLLGRIPGRIL